MCQQYFYQEKKFHYIFSLGSMVCNDNFIVFSSVLSLSETNH